MLCEFCDEQLPTVEPENIALLAHVRAKAYCGEQFDFMIENLNASWTDAMSGG